MIVVRRAQMEVLARTALEPFVENVAAHLRRVWPAETAAMGEAALDALVRDAMVRASRWGIETEFDVGRFCDLMFLWSTDFDTRAELPWVQEILGADGYDGRVKVDLLMERTKALCDDAANALAAAEG